MNGIAKFELEPFQQLEDQHVDAQTSELGAYLRARRALIPPEEAGLPREPGRRVRGLRRDEVARLAGISQDYYMRLEQGRDRHPSAQVLYALGRALRLDEFAVSYMTRIASLEQEETAPTATLEATLMALLQQWPKYPAIIVDPNQDVVAANRVARILGPIGLTVGMNLVTTIVMTPTRDLQPDWEATATEQVAALRFHGNPNDPRFQEVVGTLLQMSADFRRIWSRHDARPFGHRIIRVPIDKLGVVELRSQLFTIPNRPGYHLAVLFPDAGSPAEAALAYLAASPD